MKLMNLLPFMDDEDIQELLKKIKSKEVKGVKYMHLFPFLDRTDVDEVVDFLVEDQNTKDLYGALPFMSNARLNKLYEEVQEGKVKGFKETALLPFLGKSKIKDMVNDLIKKGFDDDLEDEISVTVSKAVKDAFDE